MAEKANLLELLQLIKANQAGLKMASLEPLKRYVNAIIRYISREDRADVWNQFLYNVYRSENLPEEAYQAPLFIRSRVINALTRLGHIRDTRYHAGRRIIPVLVEEWILEETSSEDLSFDRIETQIEFHRVFGEQKAILDPEDVQNSQTAAEELWSDRSNLFD